MGNGIDFNLFSDCTKSFLVNASTEFVAAF